ncbi:MAG: thrombospondin type 3 repeat-containing protein [Gammaproteobacteria bacterium]
MKHKFYGFVLLVLTCGSADAVSVNLTSGASGTNFGNQSFSGETRAANVTVLGPSNLVVSSMTLNLVDIQAGTATIGARIYNATTQALVASADVMPAVANNQSVTIPISATLIAGQSYRLGFFVGAGAGNSADMFDPIPASYTEANGLLQITGAHSAGGDVFPNLSNIFIPLNMGLEVYAANAMPYNLVGSYQRLLSTGSLRSLMFRAGAAQGCPGPTYQQPCYNPATDGGAAASVSIAAPSWTWNGATLAESGLFWATLFIDDNPNSWPVMGDLVTNLIITVTGPGAGTTNAATYYCIESGFLPSVGQSGCANVSFGFNEGNETTAVWNVNGNPKCVSMTIGGDDWSLFDGSGPPDPYMAGTPSPRGLTAQAAGQAGVGCAGTSGGMSGTSGAFDLWNVIIDDGTYLILANTPDIGACHLFGTTTTSGCPADESLAGTSYLVFAAPGAPDTDGDGNLDGLDNCPSNANAGQTDADADGIGDVCDGDIDGDTVANGADNCPLSANADQADTDTDGRGNVCDNCRLVSNTAAGTVPNSGAPGVPKYQLDSDSDGYGNACDADINNSGGTTSTDFAILRSVIGQVYSFSLNAARSDMNGSGSVTSSDFAMLRSRIGSAPGPSGLACAGSVPCP